jgi:hypothetical protein
MVWYSYSAIAKILSLAQEKKKCPIKYDSTQGNQSVAIKSDRNIVFQESHSGIYYHDTKNRAYVMLTTTKEAIVDTIKANREGFADRDYERAKRAGKALGLVRYPSPRYLKNMVSSIMIKNCPVTPSNVDNANKIFGPDLATLKGKTVRVTPPVVMTDYVQIPQEIVSLNRNVKLGIDIMFVNGLPFMVSISCKIKFTTVEYLLGWKQPQLVNSIRKIINLYQTRGFTIDTALMDRKFECLRSDLPELNLNATAARKHVPDVERQIRVLEERSRAIWSTLPFQAISGRIIIALVYYAAFWLNAFPPSISVSATYSPRTIMTGTTLDFAKHCKLPFGAYAEDHEEYPQTNTMAQRTGGVVCLRPMGNFKGSYKMMCLTTGRKITRKQFQELPMPASVIKRIKTIADKEQQDKTLVFTYRNANPIEDDDVSAGVDDNENDNDNDDGGNAINSPGILLDGPVGSEANESEDEDNTEDLNDESAGVPIHLHHEEITGVHDEGGDPTANDKPETEKTPQAKTPGVVAETTGVAETPVVVAEITGVAAQTATSDTTGVVANEEEDVEEEPDVEPYNPDTWTPSVQRVHGLCPRKGREYSHLHSTVVHYAMMQNSLKKGIKKFKKVGEAAISKELLQLHMRETFAPQNAKELSSEQNRGALGSFMFLKERRDGTIKGRACAGGRKQ